MSSKLILLLLASIYTIEAGEYKERFLTLYNQIVDSNNGYYSKEGVPYHSVENMLVETVDHGHETDSEAVRLVLNPSESQNCVISQWFEGLKPVFTLKCFYSYNVWLHAMYGGISGDFQPFNNAWSVVENYLIPETQYNSDK